TDGLLILRHLFGMTGTALTENALAGSATLTDPALVSARLKAIAPYLDIDGNGQTSALSDGLLLLRYLSGLRGAALVEGVIDAGATRTTPEQIEPYIQSLLP